MPATAALPLASPSPWVSPLAIRPSGTVFLPKEHGSWSLALEPLALGLLVAPSWAGGALAGAVLAGFFARRPLKAALVPVNSERRLAARETLVMWSALAVAGLFEAGVLGGWTALWPLLLVVPFGGLFIWCDGRNQSRDALAEVSGCVSFAFVPAALARLAGWPMEAALALAVLAAARSLSAILAVRACLRAAKGEPGGAPGALLVSALALAAVASVAALGRVPGIAPGFAALFLLRTAWLLGPWRPAWSARRIGMMEAGLGVVYVAAIAANWPPT